MSASNKFLVFAVALLVAVIGYLAIDHLGRTSAPAPSPAQRQAAPPPPSPAPATPAPAAQAAAPTAPAADTGADEAATRQAYTDCVSGLFPTQADARSRAAACSKALQSHQLKPDEIALARLVRGIVGFAAHAVELALEKRQAPRDHRAVVVHANSLGARS